LLSEDLALRWLVSAFAMAKLSLTNEGTVVRNIMAVSGIGFALALATPAFAQQTALVEMSRYGEVVVRFVDVSGLDRRGGDVEASMLVVTARPECEAAPVSAVLRTYRISCDWNVYVESESKDIGMDGQATATPAFQRIMGFFGQRGLEASLAAIVCDPAFKAPQGAHASIRDAVAEAARTTKRPPAPQPTDAPIPTAPAPPPAPQRKLPNFEVQQPSAYALVLSDKSNGNALFLDWGNFRRKRDQIQALTFWVLADDPQAKEVSELMRHVSVEIDCRAKTMREVADQTFGRGLKPHYGGSTASAAFAPVAGSPLRTELLNAACKGRPPKKALATMSEAVVAAAAAAKK
jgi:hypothetical protein